MSNGRTAASFKEPFLTGLDLRKVSTDNESTQRRDTACGLSMLQIASTPMVTYAGELAPSTNKGSSRTRKRKRYRYIGEAFSMA